MPSLSELDPRLRPYAEQFVAAVRRHGWRVDITSVYRSRAKQAQLYRAYQEGRTGGIPVAPPGQSLHGYRLAFDMVVNRDYHSEAQKVVGRAWNALGGRWSERDPVHFTVHLS